MSWFYESISMAYRFKTIEERPGVKNAPSPLLAFLLWLSSLRNGERLLFCTVGNNKFCLLFSRSFLTVELLIIIADRITDKVFSICDNNGLVTHIISKTFNKVRHALRILVYFFVQSYKKSPVTTPKRHLFICHILTCRFQYEADLRTIISIYSPWNHIKIIGFLMAPRGTEDH